MWILCGQVFGWKFHYYVKEDEGCPLWLLPDSPWGTFLPSPLRVRDCCGLQGWAGVPAWLIGRSITMTAEIGLQLSRQPKQSQSALVPGPSPSSGKETACFSGAALLVEQNPGAAFGSCISSCDCEGKQRKAGGTHWEIQTHGGTWILLHLSPSHCPLCTPPGSQWSPHWCSALASVSLYLHICLSVYYEIALNDSPRNPLELMSHFVLKTSNGLPCVPWLRLQWPMGPSTCLPMWLPPHFITPSLPLLLQTHWPLCCAAHMLGTFPLRGICSCCTLCLGASPPKFRQGLPPLFLWSLFSRHFFSRSSSLPSLLPHIPYAPGHCFLLQEPACLDLRAPSSSLWARGQTFWGSQHLWD